ncbi:YhcN/YlaJ family sporulation lipoprotein [Thalassobacillus hwangdonensis]|uniref:YhcN/YlaJ family sporulation lipoprotein n=1 Tax=Thalassobacillus hwangdonensis TaxID=546108 RepID=A0ABW3KXI1_9BACI
MKIKMLTVGLLAASALVACQAEQGQEEGQGNYNGVENTRFERPADDMYEDMNNDINDVDNDRGMVNNTNYKVAERAADRIADQVDGIDRAYVLKTRDNAYVAADMKDGSQNNGKVSDDVKKQISDIVKKTDQNIDNVYVSTNADFVDLSRNYVRDVDRGEPVQGFFREFGEMVDRIFPEAK